MIDSAIKMECSGCHKLIPTTKFYEHLMEIDDEQTDIDRENDQGYCNNCIRNSLNNICGEESEF